MVDEWIEKINEFGGEKTKMIVIVGNKKDPDMKEKDVKISFAEATERTAQLKEELKMQGKAVYLEPPVSAKHGFGKGEDAKNVGVEKLFQNVAEYWRALQKQRTQSILTNPMQQQQLMYNDYEDDARSQGDMLALNQVKFDLYDDQYDDLEQQGLKSPKLLYSAQKKGRKRDGQKKKEGGEKKGCCS